MQVTVSKARLKNKSKRLEDAARKRIYKALDESIDYLSFSVPVDTGAYANSMHLNSRGDVSGQGISSSRKERQQDANPILNEMEARLRAGLDNTDLLNGATIVNNAPHARYVEAKFGIFDQLRNFLK
jgi:hypothetical protein